MFRRFLKPSSEQPPDHNQLAKVIGVVLSHKQGLAENALDANPFRPGTPDNFRDERVDAQTKSEAISSVRPQTWGVEENKRTRNADRFSLRLDGWRESVGVQAEIRLAGELVKPVSYLAPVLCR